jgi:electron transfer flavoprotein alpha subunit
MKNTGDFKDIWVFAEHMRGKLSPVYYELMGKAKELLQAMEDGNRVCAVILGSGIDSLISELEKSGADRIYCMDDERLEMYNPDYYSGALKYMVEAYKPEIVLVGATALGSEIAPTVAARVGTGLAAHCMDLKIQDGRFVQVVPAFGGRVLGEIFTPDFRPMMASIKPGAFQRKPCSPGKGELVKEKGGCLDSIETRIKLLGVYKEEPAGLPVEEAEAVICGGYGMGSSENWALLNELAGLLKGAVGCTRPSLDEGWAESEDSMIGTSGKSIRPRVYIGAGISGATHHICGMKDSGFIVSINHDKDAPIFDVSDIKIVGDAGDILRALIEALKK